MCYTRQKNWKRKEEDIDLTQVKFTIFSLNLIFKSLCVKITWIQFQIIDYSLIKIKRKRLLKMFCCCAKTRKDGDSDSITGFEGRYKSLQMLLLEFIKEENSLKMKDIELADLTYKLY